MAAKFDVEATKSDMFSFLPEDIDIKAHLNGRTELPDIDWLVASILQNGQLQNCIVRKDGSDKPCLGLGFSRWRAVSLINELIASETKAAKWLKDHPGIALPPSPLKLKCVFLKMSEKDAFIANINENLARNPTNETDHVNNVKMLDKWEVSHEQIAGIYRRSVSWVKKCLKIASCEPEVQKAIKDGRLKLSAAAAIAKLSSEQQREKVSGEGPVERVKDEKAKPTPKQARATFDNFRDKVEGKKKDLCEKISFFLSGQISEDEVYAALLEI